LFAIIIKQELQKVKQERGQYRLELEHERIWKRKEEEYEWSILELSYMKPTNRLFLSEVIVVMGILNY
jgi:hypothetical protein